VKVVSPESVVMVPISIKKKPIGSMPTLPTDPRIIVVTLGRRADVRDFILTFPPAFN
jgi:hypothetical protein